MRRGGIFTLFKRFFSIGHQAQKLPAGSKKVEQISNCEHKRGTFANANARTAFKEGQVLTGKVMRIDQSSIYFSVPGASSVVLSAKNFAKEQAGKKACDCLAVGQKCRICVKAWYPQTRQIVLSGRVEALGTPEGSRRGSERRSVKPDYEIIPRGTPIMVDGANFLGDFEPCDATRAITSLFAGLREQGYEPTIYLEHRTWKYLSCNQESEEAATEFHRACKDLDVTIVGREADVTILQALGSIPEAVGVTNDHYADYAKAFPSIVGSSRLRGFVVSTIGKDKFIMIDGLVQAIQLREHVVQKSYMHETAGEAVNQNLPHVSVRKFTKDSTSGLCGHGNALLEKKRLHGAIHCFEKVISQNNADGYVGLAEVCDCQGDAKTAAKFTLLGEKLERRMRDREIRNRRIAAERRRIGDGCYAKCA